MSRMSPSSRWSHGTYKIFIRCKIFKYHDCSHRTIKSNFMPFFNFRDTLSYSWLVRKILSLLEFFLSQFSPIFGLHSQCLSAIHFTRWPNVTFIHNSADVRSIFSFFPRELCDISRTHWWQIKTKNLKNLRLLQYWITCNPFLISIVTSHNHIEVIVPISSEAYRLKFSASSFYLFMENFSQPFGKRSAAALLELREISNGTEIAVIHPPYCALEARCVRFN